MVSQVIMAFLHKASLLESHRCCARPQHVWEAKESQLPSAGEGTGLGHICGFGFYSEKELQGDVLDRN